MTEVVEKVKRPASQYYWGDWFKDVALQTCSLPARGLWHEMNCLMHQGEPYGHLTMPNGKPMQPAQLASLCKISPTTCKKLIQELDDNGVSSIADSGAIFSRRMVRDEDLRNRRAAGGKEGAEHGAKGGESGAKGGRPPKGKGGFETPLQTPLGGFEEPPPSSSSSSSASAGSVSIETGTAGASVDGKPKKSPEELAKSQLWKAAVSLLATQGLPEPQARTLFGKLNKDYPGGEIVQRAVEATVAEQPADARTYLIATCKTIAGERAGRGANGTLNPHRGFESRNYEDYPDGQPPA